MGFVFAISFVVNGLCVFLFWVVGKMCLILFLRGVSYLLAKIKRQVGDVCSFLYDVGLDCECFHIVFLSIVLGRHEMPPEFGLCYLTGIF